MVASMLMSLLLGDHYPSERSLENYSLRNKALHLTVLRQFGRFLVQRGVLNEYFLRNLHGPGRFKHHTKDFLSLRQLNKVIEVFRSRSNFQRHTRPHHYLFDG